MTDRAYYHSPVGRLLLEADASQLTRLAFDEAPVITVQHPTPVLQQCMQELDEYFGGRRKRFSVPLAPSGSAFQERVWQQLLTIPFAKTISYAQLAMQLGNSKFIRAAGTANGKNPIAIIIPCHRVIGSDGSLVGYGGGLWRKKWLLDFERKGKQGELFD